MEEKIVENISKAKEIINASLMNSNERNCFDFNKPYLHSNEGDFYKYLDMQGKNVLTVGSSGDQVLYSLLYGANSVTLFDLNPFTRYFFELKSAAIQSLPMSQTKQLFFLKSSKEFDFSKVLTKLYPKMSEESSAFWQELGKDFSHKEIIDGLFVKYASRYPSFMQNNGDYLALRDVLQSNPSINFIESNLHDLPNFLQQSSKFDFGLISNVLDYYNPDEFKQDIKQLIPFMNNDGLVQVNYSYRYANIKNHIKFPHKLEDVNNLFGINAINGKIYPHIRDVMPAPKRHEGSFALPVLRENAIFLPVNDLKELYTQEDNSVVKNIEDNEDNISDQSEITDIHTGCQTGREIVEHFKIESVEKNADSISTNNLDDVNSVQNEVATNQEITVKPEITVNPEAMA